MRRLAAATLAATMLLLAACGSDDGGTTGGQVDSIETVAGATGSCMQENGFETALTNEIFVVETERTFAPTEGYSVLAVADDGRDVQVMIFADPQLATAYERDAASDGDDIIREKVAGGRVVVESGFRAEDGPGLEEPADEETLAAIESCVTDAGL